MMVLLFGGWTSHLDVRTSLPTPLAPSKYEWFGGLNNKFVQERKGKETFNRNQIKRNITIRQ